MEAMSCAICGDVNLLQAGGGYHMANRSGNMAYDYWCKNCGTLHTRIECPFRVEHIVQTPEKLHT